ncbi:MAG: type III-A CRISPR-associated RAMP protein Csm5 [Rhodocyclaceae bacterium]|nr:type III-A CRISPR-associated RAMP protein Csm5 [Rhodocyclaceae bacterium]
MKFLETFDLVISTLSPVHIGCGEDYEPTNYVIENKSLYAFDPVRLITKLEASAREELLRLLDKPQPLLALQRFFFRHRELAMELSSHQVPLAEAAADFYASRIGQVAQREGGGKQVLNKLEIARTAFDPISQLPILPGSSLKGAMRTALLEWLRAQSNKGFPLANPANHREASRFANEMEADLLEGSFETDPMRLIKIADAHFVPGSYKAKNAQGEEIQRERQARTILFQANRKKRPNQFDARGSIETLVECVPASQPRAFVTQLVIEQKANRGEKTPKRQFDFATLASACHRFYFARFEQELALLEANQYVSSAWAQNARNRLSPSGLWGKAIAEGRGFLLRIGRHSGAESVTIDAPRKIKILKGKDNPPDWASEATTLWLAANEPKASGGMWPFGWVFVQLK